MHTAKMTIRLPDNDLAFAKRYAKEQGISLTALILRYFSRLSHATEQETLPEVRIIAGIVPSRIDAEKKHRSHLTGKHS